MTQLLAGYRVIESSMLLNGAATGMMLADLGAEVIKIESPFLGDYLRIPETMHMHRQTNKGKRSLTLDLRKDAGRAVAYRLLATADVFLTNAVSNRNEKLGIGYAQLKERKPDIIYCQNTGFGAVGPYAEMPTHGQMMDALAGAIPVEMCEDGLVRPRRDYVRRTGRMASGSEGTAAGAIYAAFHIAAALAHRARTGEGCYIDVSSAEAVVASAWIATIGQLNCARKENPYADEARNRDVARYQNYETRDKKFILFCPEEKKFWESFCVLVGRPDLKMEARGEGLRRTLQEIFHTRDRDEWVRLAIEHRLPIGPVNDSAAEVRADPHLAARGVFAEAVLPDGQLFTFVRQPAQVDGDRPRLNASAPELGEHTGAILAELGYDTAEIEKLAADRVTTSDVMLHDYLSDRVHDYVANSRDFQQR